MITNIAQRDMQIRALDIASGAGFGSELIDNSISGIVQNIALRQLGLQSALPRKPAEGTQYQTPNRTPGGGGGWVNDTAAAANGTGTYTLLTFDIMTLLVEGKVSRRLIGAGRTYTDVLAVEIEHVTSDAASRIEVGIINLDGSVADQPKGFLKLIHAYPGQVVANSVAAGGAALDDGKLQLGIDKVTGSANASDMIICASLHGRREIGAVASAQNRYTGDVEYGIGFKAKSYEHIPIIVSTGVSDIYEYLAAAIVLTFAAGTAKETAVAANQSTAIMVLNTRHAFLAEATPLTFMQLAQESSQYTKFHIYADLTPVLDNEFGASVIVGVKAP